MTKEQLSVMTVKELKEIAKENGLKGYSKLRKAELIELLTIEVTREEPAQAENSKQDDTKVSASDLLECGEVITWTETNNLYMPRYYKYSNNTIYYTDAEHNFKWLESSATIDDFKSSFDYVSAKVGRL